MRVAAKLQRTHIRNDGPAIARLNLRGITVHGAKTVGDDVVDVTVGNLTQTILMITGRMLHAAHRHHTLPVALQTVARSAENFITILAALEQFLGEGKREGVGILHDEQWIILDRATRYGIFNGL